MMARCRNNCQVCLVLESGRKWSPGYEISDDSWKIVPAVVCLLEEDLHSFVFVDQHHILMKMKDCCSFLSQEELHQHHQLCDPGVGDLLFQ